MSSFDQAKQPVARAKRLKDYREVAKSLFMWAEYMGGFEAPAWRNLETLLVKDGQIEKSDVR